MRVALDERLVQALFLYEALDLASVRFYEVAVAVGAQEVGETRHGLDRVVGLAEVEDEVELPVVEAEELGERGEEHAEEGRAAPDGREAVARQADVGEAALQGEEFSEEVVLPL